PQPHRPPQPLRLTRKKLHRTHGRQADDHRARWRRIVQLNVLGFACAEMQDKGAFEAVKISRFIVDGGPPTVAIRNGNKARRHRLLLLDTRSRGVRSPWRGALPSARSPL